MKNLLALLGIVALLLTGGSQSTIAAKSNAPNSKPTMAYSYCTSWGIENVSDNYVRFFSPWLYTQGINGGYDYLHDVIITYVGQYEPGHGSNCDVFKQYEEEQYTYYHTPGSYHTAMRVWVCGNTLPWGPDQIPEPGASNVNLLWTDTIYYPTPGCGRQADSWGSYFNGSSGGYAAVYVTA